MPYSLPVPRPQPRAQSFKYLDKILQRLQAQGLVTSRTITEAHMHSEDTAAAIKDILHILGAAKRQTHF